MTSNGEILAVFLIKNVSKAGAQYFSVLAKNHSALSIYQHALKNQLLHISGELFGKQIILEQIEILHEEIAIEHESTTNHIDQLPKKTYTEKERIILH